MYNPLARLLCFVRPVCCLLPAISLAIGLTARAELVATNVESAGPNFPFVGEFAGVVVGETDEEREVTLQIRATGQGGFEGLLYLEGSALTKNPQVLPTSLIGKRFEDLLVLSGGPWALMARRDDVLVIDRQGKNAGELERVNRTSPTLGAVAPKGAMVLFERAAPAQSTHEESNPDAQDAAKRAEEATNSTNAQGASAEKETDAEREAASLATQMFTQAELTEDGYLQGNTLFLPMFRDFDLHLEFKVPFVPERRGQNRGNSGVYLQSRYECQILDSFALPIEIDGCGALYRQRKPDVNACLPPLSWQTYDISFTAARFGSDGTKMRNARITVWLNGVKVHDDVELKNKTGAGRPEEPTQLPIRLQDHGNPVHFRNIWAIDRGLAPTKDFPPN